MGKQLRDDPLGLRAQLTVSPPEETIDTPIETGGDDPLGLRSALKKKESTVEESPSQSAGSPDSSEPAKQVETPSSNPTTDDWGAKQIAMNPLLSGLISAGKQIYSGLADQTPKTIAQSLEVTKSAMQSATPEDYAKNHKPVDFQKYVREKEGLRWYQPFDMDKYLPKYAKQFVEEKHPDILKKIEARQPEIIQRRLETEQYVQQQNKEAAETLAGIPQSYKEIKSTKDAVDYAFNMGAQGLWQIPLTVLTKGLSGEMMEASAVYDAQLDALAEKHKISREEVIRKGLDKPAEGQLYALAAAGLDRVSAGGLIDIVKKGGAPLLRTVLSTTFEAATEATQGSLEEVGGAKGAGLSEVEAFKKAWTTNLSKRIDEAIGGIAGAAAVNIAGKATKTIAQVISTEKADIKNTADLGNTKKAADEIVDRLKSTPDEAVTGVEDKFKKLATPEEGAVNDSQNQQRPSGEERVGKESVQAQPDNGGSQETTGPSGVVQTPSPLQGQEKVETPIPEATEGATQTESTNAEETDQGGQEGLQLTPPSEGSKGEGLPNQPSPASGQSAETNESTTDTGSNALSDQQAAPRTADQISTLLKTPIPKEMRGETVNIKTVDPKTGTVTQQQMPAGSAHLVMRKQYKALENIVNCLTK